MSQPLRAIPRLRGVGHTARPTWKLRETVQFYRDILSLELAHHTAALERGCEKESHADFTHFFSDSRNDSPITFVLRRSRSRFEV